MYVGSSKVTREGVNGSKEVTYQITYVDGKEESRKKVKEKVIKEPVSKIVTEGTKKNHSNLHRNLLVLENISFQNEKYRTVMVPVMATGKSSIQTEQ